MNSKIYYILLIGSLIVLVVVLGVGFYYAAFGNLTKLFPSTANKQPANQQSLNPLASPSSGPQASLQMDESGRVYFIWSQLSSGVTEIKIYRALRGETSWRLWKTVSVMNNQGGRVQLQSTNTPGLLNYSYYFEAVSGSGQTVWSSDPQSISTPGSTNSPPPTNTSLGQDQTPLPNNGTSGNTQSTSSNTSDSSGSQSSSSAPTNQNTLTPPAPTSTPPGATNTITYYTTAGQISGSVSPPSQNFWVRHVNKKIEISWQNLPADTSKIVVSRAPDQNGPWTTLLSQEQPVLTGPYTIYLVDEAVNTSSYYLLQAYATSSSATASFGPVFLGPLGQ